MHEVALMEDIITTIDKDVKARKLDYVENIELIVGDLSSAMPEALQMAFDMIKAEGRFPCLLLDATLTIQREEAEAKCIVCGKTYQPDRKLAFCPDCNGPFGKMVK